MKLELKASLPACIYYVDKYTPSSTKNPKVIAINFIDVSG